MDMLNGLGPGFSTGSFARKSFSPGLSGTGFGASCPCRHGSINRHTQQIHTLEVLLGLLLGILTGQGLQGSQGLGGSPLNGNSLGAGTRASPAKGNSSAGSGGGAPAGGARAGAGPVGTPPHGPISEEDKQWLTGDVDGLNPRLANALAQVGKQLGKKIDIRSGFRSHQEQEALYQKYLNGTGNLAAKPGSSNHESGNAADVYVDGVPLNSHPQASQAARQVGIHFPVGGEPWHAELVGVKA